jgi:multidrug efflux system membrane fusion protein
VLKRLRAGASLTVTAYDRSQQTKLATGTLSTVDNQIDVTTGTVKLRAQFTNDDESLFPNQFVNIQLLVDTQHDALIVPTSAIQRGAPGTFVYAVQPDSTVKVAPVKLGPTANDKVAITSGVAVGDKLVTDGADKLRDGAKVSLATEPAAAGASGGPAPASGGQPAAPAGGQAAPAGQPAAPAGQQAAPAGQQAAPAGQTDGTAPAQGQRRRRNSQ